MKGQLKRLGRAQSAGQYTKFDEIELGEHALNNLYVPPKLEHYLRENQYREIELGIWTLMWFKILIALGTTDGKVRRWGTFLLSMHTLAAVVLTPIAFMAAFAAGSFVWLGVAFVLLYDVQILNGWRVVFTVAPINSASSPTRGA